MRDNVYTKEKKPRNEWEEDLKSLEEEYNHIREDWRITRGKQEEVCYVVILPHKITCPNFYHKYFSITAEDVLIIPQLVKYVFHHNYLVDKNYFHCSWSITSSIAGGQLLLPLQLVNLFHCRRSTACSIAAGQLLFPF